MCRHHHAVGREATKTASVTLTVALHLSLCGFQVSLDGILQPETRAPSLSEIRRQLRVENLLLKSVWSHPHEVFSPPEILSDQRSSIDGSPVRSSISLFVTLSIQVILMNERKCRTMKACSFFTCRLYIVQASAPYRRVDSTIAR